MSSGNAVLDLTPKSQTKEKTPVGLQSAQLCFLGRADPQDGATPQPASDRGPRPAGADTAHGGTASEHAEGACHTPGPHTPNRESEQVPVGDRPRHPGKSDAGWCRARSPLQVCTQERGCASMRSRAPRQSRRDGWDTFTAEHLAQTARRRHPTKACILGGSRVLCGWQATLQVSAQLLAHPREDPAPTPADKAISSSLCCGFYVTWAESCRVAWWLRSDPAPLLPARTSATTHLCRPGQVSSARHCGAQCPFDDPRPWASLWTRHRCMRSHGVPRALVPEGPPENAQPLVSWPRVDTLSSETDAPAKATRHTRPFRASWTQGQRTVRGVPEELLAQVCGRPRPPRSGGGSRVRGHTRGLSAGPAAGHCCPWRTSAFLLEERRGSPGGLGGACRAVGVPAGLRLLCG